MVRMSLAGAIIISLIIFSVVLAGCESTPVLRNQSGTVRVISSPPGAEVYLNGEYRGTTPATITAIQAGNYSLEVRATGYDRWTSPVIVKPGSLANVSAILSAIPVTAIPATFATASTPAVLPGNPDIHIEGYWTYPQGVGSSTENPVPILIHADGFNVGDAGARIVTASANLYYSGHQVCWKSVYFGTLNAGGHVATDTMVSCPLPSNIKSGDLTIRFENVVVTP
jgi:hypothetical protein